MISLCKRGKFNKIITYKLDRISRSLLDFVLLLEDLCENSIELISCTESFSSKSEMGVLIMKLLIMFAEMERKNIRLRVRDNYYARGEKGFYLGGYAPFGYRKIEIFIDGKKTSSYEIIESEAEIVKEIYEKICYENKSATYICRQLNERKILTKKGCKWSVSSLTRLIKNPFYVEADYKIYDFFLFNGAKITSSPEVFTGKNGCICYGEKSNRKGGKFASFTGEHITVGRHLSIISSQLWLEARKKLCSSFCIKAKNSSASFLSGIIICKNCGKKYTITSSKGIVYFYCRGRKCKACDTKVSSIRGDFLENIAVFLIKKALLNLGKCRKSIEKTVEEGQLRCEISQNRKRILLLKDELKSGESEINVLVEAIRELEFEISKKEKRLYEIVEKQRNLCYTEISELGRDFERFSNTTKNVIAKEMIIKIEISQGKIKIYLRNRKGFFDD